MRQKLICQYWKFVFDEINVPILLCTVLKCVNLRKSFSTQQTRPISIKCCNCIAFQFEFFFSNTRLFNQWKVNRTFLEMKLFWLHSLYSSKNYLFVIYTFRCGDTYPFDVIIFELLAKYFSNNYGTLSSIIHSFTIQAITCYPRCNGPSHIVLNNLSTTISCKLFRRSYRALL